MPRCLNLSELVYVRHRAAELMRRRHLGVNQTLPKNRSRTGAGTSDCCLKQGKSPSTACGRALPVQLNPSQPGPTRLRSCGAGPG